MKQLWDLFISFWKIGAFTFGGGYAMVSLLDHECVEKKAWLTSDELMDITIIAESTPGPIAINCATYTGYKVAGMKGAVSATIGIILPSFLIMVILSRVFENTLAVPVISRAFRGIRIAVAILIIRAAAKMIKKTLKKSQNPKKQILIIGFCFFLVLVLKIVRIHISTIYFILCSGLLGFFLFRSPKEENTGRDKS